MFNNVYKHHKLGGVFVFNYLDQPHNILTEGDKIPVYLFNMKQKSLIMLTERIVFKDNLSIINAYYEKTESDRKTTRYIAALTKSILNKQLIHDITDNTQFQKESENMVMTVEGLLRFEVLTKK
ncbi:hypothetical protein [Alkaliphilus hydrothermalis]|uniref:Uncharacterized protein n=1 Tax=Alkaliphilus hydrothermalis TaxID=1482730 RepID=A0ABS2NLZ3_9FIRM|nr:hypothetical protein [Alkaliphilus hydrothermalis]MBM7613946.1 hypothetical protein [Alkaliphilus hydrothermalis]